MQLTFPSRGMLYHYSPELKCPAPAQQTHRDTHNNCLAKDHARVSQAMAWSQAAAAGRLLRSVGEGPVRRQAGSILLLLLLPVCKLAD